VKGFLLYDKVCDLNKKIATGEGMEGTQASID
jgi:hypothetical protein